MAAADPAEQAFRPEDRFRVRMRREREKRDWSQAELAERMADYGVKLHASAIAKMEAIGPGARSIRLDEAAAAAAALGSTLNDMTSPPSSEVVQVLEILREALARHRDARDLEQKAENLMREAMSDFPRGELRSRALHPGMAATVGDIITRLDEFRRETGETQDGER